jgi:hypothetical protein
LGGGGARGSGVRGFRILSGGGEEGDVPVGLLIGGDGCLGEVLGGKLGLEFSGGGCGALPAARNNSRINRAQEIDRKTKHEADLANRNGTLRRKQSKTHAHVSES